MSTTLEPGTQEKTDVLTEEEIEEFVRKMNQSEDPLKCQHSHRDSECLVTVVARGRSCEATLNFCENARRSNQRIIDQGITCAGCDRLARECWRIWYI